MYKRQVKDGYVATSGWLVQTKTHYLDFLKELENIGVQYIVCTDISKDGTSVSYTHLDVYKRQALAGPNVPSFSKK